MLEDRARSLGVAVGLGFLQAAGLLVGGAVLCLTSCLACGVPVLVLTDW